MEQSVIEHLKSISVAKHIILIDSLKCIPRRIGGNQMRHSLAVFGILLDYKCFDSICLKLALLHDILEDHPEKKYHLDEIKQQIIDTDEEGAEVLLRVEEISIKKNETKELYLKRLIDSKYNRVKLVKGADRISNFTDLNSDFTNISKIELTCQHTENYIIPMLNTLTKFNYQAGNMIIELNDLIDKRREIIRNLKARVF